MKSISTATFLPNIGHCNVQLRTDRPRYVSISVELPNLGLSIVRELAKLLCGNVTLQSDVGRGSTFTLTVAARLPLEPLADLESHRV